MQFIAEAATDVGRKRTQNQDSFAISPEMGFFVVADGMGGHRGGEIASAMVTEKMPEVVKTLLGPANWNPREVIVEALRAANQAVHERAIRDPQLRGMGTTATSLLFKENRLVIGHVGDSRCYYVQPEGIWQATRDHSLV